MNASDATRGLRSPDTADKSPATSEIVVAYRDPQTEQLILSGSESIHEEIRAHATIDLEASR